MIENRKFSPQKLYKLARVVVIIICLGNIGLAYFFQNQVSYYSNKEIKDLESCKKQYPTVGDADLKGWEFCITIDPNADQKSKQLSIDYEYDQIKLAILLPLLFFGGAWIYKYIFPKGNDNEKNK